MSRLLHLFCMLIIFCAPSLCQADDAAMASSLFEAGNQAYESEQWPLAISKYQQALKISQGNHVLYYNLGNAYFKQDQLGQAIRYYQKALRITPRSRVIQENLELARLRTQDKVSKPDLGFVLSVFQQMHEAVSPNELVVTICLLWLATCLVLALRIYLNQPLLGPTSALLLGLLLLPGISLGTKFYQYEVLRQAVIIEKETAVYSGPGESYQLTFSLHEGTNILVEQQRKEWSEISVGKNLKGWINSQSLAGI